MPRIVDSLGHMLGYLDDGATLFVRHKGRAMRVTGGTVTIECESCHVETTLDLDHYTYAVSTANLQGLTGMH